MKTKIKENTAKIINRQQYGEARASFQCDVEAEFGGRLRGGFISGKYFYTCTTAFWQVEIANLSAKSPIHVQGHGLNDVLCAVGFTSVDAAHGNKLIYNERDECIGTMDARETWVALRTLGYICKCYDLPGGCDPE